MFPEFLLKDFDAFDFFIDRPVGAEAALICIVFAKKAYRSSRQIKRFQYKDIRKKS
jgi:hypothetical protein